MTTSVKGECTEVARREGGKASGKKKHLQRPRDPGKTLVENSGSDQGHNPSEGKKEQSKQSNKNNGGRMKNRGKFRAWRIHA